MKTRGLIVRTLLLALLLSPSSALRAFGSRMLASSWQPQKQQLQAEPTAEGMAGAVNLSVVSVPGHRAPAQRLHKSRGKRINIDSALLPAPGSSAIDRLLFSDMAMVQKELDCPNPPRGPPTLLSL